MSQVVFLSKLVRRTIIQAFMWPGGVVKVDPPLGCSQKVSQRAIRLTLSDGQLKEPHKALRIAIVGRRPGSAHPTDKALLQQERSGLRPPILLALVGVKDRC